jgi:hypothetical protein
MNILFLILYLILPFTRVGSGDSFDIGLWEQGDNPGAGSQDFTIFTDTGLNGNFKRLYRAVKTVLTASGGLNAGVITGASLATSVADGSTLEVVSGSMRVKDGGVSTAKLAAQAVTTAKMALLSVDSTILASDASVDANRAVTTNSIKDGAVLGSKISHDNSRMKCFVVMAQKTLSASVFGFIGDVQFTANLGIRMSQAGSFTSFQGKGSAGAEAAGVNAAYGTQTFTVNDYIGCTYTAAGTNIAITKNGSATGLQINVSGFTAPVLLTLELELQ